MTKVGRRSFLRFLASIGLVALSGDLFSEKGKDILEIVEQQQESTIPHMIPYPKPVEGADFAMAIDVGACIGCRRCLHACKLENNVPDAPSNMEWIDLFEMDNNDSVSKIERIPPEGGDPYYTESPEKGFWYFSFNCFHCEDPPCTKVCPTGATYKDKDGLVLVDYSLCIGCRACLGACPYNARRFNWWKPDLPKERLNPITGEMEPLNPLVPVRDKGVMEKCTFCVHRIRAGNPVPRCVEVCPTRARHFGDLNDPNTEVYKIRNQLITVRIREDLGTSPHLFYFTRGKKWLASGEMV
jgi:Fe-S-cluster-containing dehydrogenase component